MRKDRPGDQGRGGVATLVLSSIPYREVQLNTNLEIIKIIITINKHDYEIINCYNPPGHTITCQYLTSLATNKNTIICGDFNAHSALWQSGHTNKAGREVEQFLDESNYVLTNDHTPTHYAPHCSASILDLVVVSPGIAARCDTRVYDDTLGSDHCPVILDFNSAATALTANTHHGNAASHFFPRWRTSKADWSRFQSEAETLITNNLIDEHAQTFADNFTTALTDVANRTLTSVHKANANGNRPRHACVWWTRDCTSAIRRRNKLRNKLRYTNDINISVQYKKAVAAARHTIRQAKAHHWQDTCNSLNERTGVHKIWKIVKGLKNNKSGNTAHNITYLEDSNGIVTADEGQVSILLQHAFFGGCPEPDTAGPRRQVHDADAQTQPVSVDNTCTHINQPFLFHELQCALNHTTQSSPGSDGIDYNIIKHLPRACLLVLLHLFNNVWSAGLIPHQWKHSIVIPIHKPGKPIRQPTSYRPISLTSCLGKLLERIVTVRLTNYLNTNNIIPLEQSGFRAGRSTADHLATLSDDINKTICNKGTTLAVFIDIEKAFDNLDHTTLLEKLANIKLCGNMLAYIRDFLHNRKSCIKVKNFYSSSFTVNKGVPQGSVISPTLFNIYLYDLPSSVSDQRRVRISLFADDVAIWASSTMRAGPSVQTQHVQTALDELDVWAHTNKLALSQTKTVAVQFTKRLNLPQPQLKLNNQPIAANTSAKFLGVIFDNRLTFVAHANHIKQRCQSYINIMRCVSHARWGCNTSRLKSLYTALIQSTTLYGIEATHIMSQAATNLLTKLQMQALRICLGAFPSTPTNILLAETNVLPLNIQIDKRLTIFCGKIKLIEQHPSNTINVDTWHNYYGTLTRSSTLLKTQNFFQSLDLHPPLLIPLDDDIPNYLWKSPIVNTELSQIINKNQNPTIIKSAFLSFQTQVATGHLHVYTDGSLDNNTGRIGAGVYIATNPSTTLSLRLSDNRSIYTAELTAIQRAVELFDFIDNPLKCNYHIFSDSLSALTFTT